MKRITRFIVLGSIAAGVGLIGGCGGTGGSSLSYGGLLVYSAGSLFTMNQSGTNIKNGPSNAFLGSMTINRKIVGSREVGGWQQIFISNADGSGEVQLTTVSADNFRPSVDPGGTKIAFISTRDGNYEIYVMNIDGTNQTRLTNETAEDYYPSISADGTKVIFSSTRDGDYEIYSINVNGTGLLRLTNNPADDLTPAWSEDGTEILFSSDRDGNYEIYRANANGSSPTRITTTPEDEFHASYSIDGLRIFYYDASIDNIRRIRPDGMNRVTITSGSNAKTACWVF